MGAFADGRRVKPAGVVERRRIEPKYLPTIERRLHRLAASGVLSAGPDGFEAAGLLPDHGPPQVAIRTPCSGGGQVVIPATKGAPEGDF